MIEDCWPIYYNSVLRSLNMNFYIPLDISSSPRNSQWSIYLQANKEQKHFMKSLSQKMQGNQNI